MIALRHHPSFPAFARVHPLTKHVILTSTVDSYFKISVAGALLDDGQLAIGGAGGDNPWFSPIHNAKVFRRRYPIRP